MYAIIKTGGKQYKVQSGQLLDVEKLEAQPGSEIKFDVLAILKEDGSTLGDPLLKNASVSAEVVSDGKADKVMVFKQLPRKSSRKLRGHRQPFTRVKIKEISGGQ